MNIVAGALAGTGPGAGWRLGADEAAANHCVAHTLRAEGFDASEDGTGRGTPLVPTYEPEVAATMVARSSRGGGQTNSPGHQADRELIAFDTTQLASAANRSNPKPGDPCHPLAAGAHAPAIAIRTANTGANGHGFSDGVAHTLDQAQGQAVAFGWQNAAAQGMAVDTISPTLDKSKHPATATATAVRRLMPVECERLQGFPDGYTAVLHRGKPAADGPRYKALGNSWAIPPVRWIGLRIAMVDALQVARAAA